MLLDFSCCTQFSSFLQRSKELRGKRYNEWTRWDYICCLIRWGGANRPVRLLFPTDLWRHTLFLLLPEKFLCRVFPRFYESIYCSLPRGHTSCFWKTMPRPWVGVYFPSTFVNKRWQCIERAFYLHFWSNFGSTFDFMCKNERPPDY